MSQILFVGGCLDSLAASALTQDFTYGSAPYFDNTYTGIAVACTNGQTTWWEATCLDGTLTPTSVVGGQTWYGHFNFNFTNPYSNGHVLLDVKDSTGNPWVSLRCKGGSPTWGLYYNSGTVAAPVWTQLGADITMAQNSAPYPRLDVVVVIGATGNHTASVYNKEALVATGTFTQALFTNIRSMRGYGGQLYGFFSEIAMTEGLSTIGARIGCSTSNAAGTNSGFTGAYTDLNDTSDTTLNTSGVAGQKTTYNVSDLTVPANNVIRAVFQWIRGKNDGSSPQNIKPVVRSGGADYVAAANAPGISGALGPLPARYDVNPATGLNWTQAEYNAAEFGFQSAA